MKKILFLSALDFKEKSIQVIRKTPEAYATAGWNVDYVVARDNVENGNYFYEDEINPFGLNVYRSYWPFPKLRNRSGRYLGLLLSKLASMIVVFKLFLQARKLLKSKHYDVIYGYELQGVLAMNLLKFFLPKSTKLVSRFQGTFLNEMFVNKQYGRILFNLDLVLAIRLNSDLLLMTNDGTQGNKAVEKIKGKKPYKMMFWPNGVDLLPTNIKEPFNKADGKIIFMSVSRLVGWKRVERNIEIMRSIKNLGFLNFVYYIIGEGDQRPFLEKIVNDFGLYDQVVFVGALKHQDVIGYLKNTDYFLSMYDSSNVGNPLLEAIRANRIIVTLDNGDTADWIIHKENGLIYDHRKIDFNVIAQDIIELSNNKNLLDYIKENIKETEKNKLWTWQERLDKEIEVVSNL